MENQDKKDAAPEQPNTVPVSAPGKTGAKAPRITVTSTALNKLQFAVKDDGSLKTITLLPGGTADLPDTEEIRKGLQPLIYQNHIKIS